MTDERAPMRAAGIMHIANGKMLLLQRSPEGDHSGEWALPGGKVEDGDADLQATARRETLEETGHDTRGDLVDHSRRIRDGVDFTTFIHRGDEEFEPVLNGEHVGWMWASPGDLPSNLHPGVKVALAKLAMNELDIARAMRDGELAGPQRYMNVWLFDLRITGTGAAYRSNGDEFTWRDPSIYLNDDFLARCNGLPVIYEHPAKTMLTSGEFSDRVVGSILLPYIKGEEVWGIAKIYDDDTVTIMRTKQMSTSPAVILAKGEGLRSDLGDGSHILIEGQPALLDHLAICEQGVWDKARAPTGVNINGDTAMADEMDGKVEDKKDGIEEVREDKRDKKDGEERMDAEGSNLDKLLSKLDAKLDAMDARMDAMEKRDSKRDAIAENGGAAEMAADKKDAAEGEKREEDKADKKDAKDSKKDEDRDEEVKAAKADAAEAKRDNKELRDRLDAMEKATKPLSDAERNELADAQARADSVMSAFGSAASHPVPGETVSAYRRRLAGSMQKNSKRWTDVDLHVLPDTAFAVAEHDIYADSAAAAMAPADIEPGILRPVIRTDRETGLRTTTFVGRNTFIKQHGRAGQRIRFTPRKEL